MKALDEKGNTLAADSGEDCVWLLYAAAYRGGDRILRYTRA